MKNICPNVTLPPEQIACQDITNPISSFIGGIEREVMIRFAKKVFSL